MRLLAFWKLPKNAGSGDPAYSNLFVRLQAQAAAYPLGTLFSAGARKTAHGGGRAHRGRCEAARPPFNLAKRN